MAKHVTLSALSMKEPEFGALPKNFSVYEKEIKQLIRKHIDTALPDEPDLIVFPECSSRYQINGKKDCEELKEYYRYLDGRIEEFLLPIATDNHVNVAYSAVRYAEPRAEKPFRNSTTYIGRDGKIHGIYDKNHLVIHESECSDIAYSDRAELIPLDIGRVASAICFDLNFDELMQKYASQKPDLTVFSSMYHGGLRQAQWAYSTQSYFVGAICKTESTILNPCGEVIATSGNYVDAVSARVNLDYRLCHLDENGAKFDAAKAKYKSGLTVHVPPYVGVALLSCNCDGITVGDIIDEFQIETLDAYFERCRAHRRKHLG